jgi:hypothetical protein
MPEIVVNLHMHTRYSDGFGTHLEIANAGLHAGLDAVIVTDHNVYVEGPEGYYEDGPRRILLLVGEEIHDQARQPQKSHLLVFGGGEELAHLASDLDRLIKTIHKNGGLAFAAHPTDPAAPAFGEDDLSWVDWQVHGLDGLEIWNGMSEFKSLLKTYLHAIYYAYNPKRIAHGPFPETLSKWDEQLELGKRLTAVGGSDAHALQVHLGPIHRVLFPYEFHFRAINTHLLIDEPLNGNLQQDRLQILQAFRGGHSFVANDMLAPARGFSFTAHGYGKRVGMGEEISAERGVTFQIRLPVATTCRLVRFGKVLQIWQNQDLCTFITTETGAYRVEVYRQYKGHKLGWIFSNPIFINP